MVKVNTSRFLKADDIGQGVTATFVDEGQYVEGKFEDESGNKKQVFQITIRIGEDTKTWSMNKTSQINMANVHGDESSVWVGKEIGLSVMTQMIGGKQLNVVYGMPVNGAVAGGTVSAEPNQGWPE